MPPDTASPSTEVEIIDPVQGEVEGAVPGRPSINYAQAIELGKVLAASGYYTDARDPAKAAVKVLIGLDLGVSPTAALQGISTFEEKGKTVFVIEGKLLAAVVKMRPDLDYRFNERTEERVEIEFFRNGASEGPPIVWDIERARRANLAGNKQKPVWDAYPREMLTWRALAEGVRVYFPDVIGGQPIYVREEFDHEVAAEVIDPRPAPLSDTKSEALREEARAAYLELKAINPARMAPGRFAGMLAAAEHSHERLASVVDALQDLAATEAELQELLVTAEGRLDKNEYKALLGRVERAGSNHERINVVDAALKEVNTDGN